MALLPQVLLPPENYYPSYESSSWQSTDARETLSWYVFDDRKLYRPGEEVNIKGWVRQVNLTPTGDTEMYPVTTGTDSQLHFERLAG